MFDIFMSALSTLNNNVLWGIPMVVLMIGTGIFLFFVIKGVVFTRFNIVMRYTTKTLFHRSDKSELEHGSISPFQAVCTALAGRSAPATSLEWHSLLLPAVLDLFFGCG